MKDNITLLDDWKAKAMLLYAGEAPNEITQLANIINKKMKGERELVDRILQTEINIFRAIRDGSGLMQHMEDFYYISLLESVKSNYQTDTGPLNKKEDDSSIS